MQNWKSAVAAVALLVAAGLSPADAFSQDVHPAAAASIERDILPTNARPERYAIALAPNVETMTFDGEATLTFQVLDPTDRITVNAVDLQIRDARLVDGPVARIEMLPDQQWVAFVFDAPLTVGEHSIHIDYRGKINETATGMFVSRFEDGGSPRTMILSQFEPGYARQIAPMWDEPAHKAVFEITLIVPEGQDTVSNMPVADTSPATNGRKAVRFQPTPVMSTYLLFTGVGDMDRITAMSAGVEIASVTRSGAGEQGRYALETLGRILPFYTDYFGTAYPLPKLDQIAAPGSGTFGAMENWGAILYFEPFLLIDPAVTTEAQRQGVFGVVSHEVAHQWFGNIVTMAWWDDLWLNEGFASWMATKAKDSFNPDWDVWLQAVGRVEGAAMEPDALSSTHPIIQPIRNAQSASFDGITYMKGQAVIRMLETYIGADAFRDGVRAYVARHAYGNTVTDDLWRALEASSGTPVTAIARDFTTMPGIPLITVDSVRCDAGVSVVSLSQGRFGADEASKAVQIWRVPVQVQTVGSDIVTKALVQGGRGEIRTPGCGPVKVNAGHSGYFRTLYSQEDFGQLEAAFGRLAPMDQLGLLFDASALGSAGYSPISNYLGLAASVSPTADPVIISQVVEALSTMAAAFQDQPGEEGFRAYGRARLRPMLAHIGWEAKPDEPANAAILRGRLIEVLSQLQDPATLAEARRRYAGSDTDTSLLPPGIRQSVLSVVGRHADAEAWEGLLARMERAETPAERTLYLEALANVENPLLGQRILDLAFSPSFPAQDALEVMRFASRRPDQTWAKIMSDRERFVAITPPDFIVSLLAQVATPSGRRDRIEELRTYVSANHPGEQESEVAQAAAAVDLLDRTRRDRLPEVTAWLRSRK